MEWSKKKTIQFIECYRSYPILWDTKHEFYKRKVKRHNALLEIAAKFEIEKSEVERKIKNLQSHFSRETKKEEDSRKDGSEADKIFVSKWFAYKPLLFLLSRDKRSKKMDSQMNNSSIELLKKEDDRIEIVALEECQKRKSNERHINEKVSEAYPIMGEVYENRSERDEFALFGEQVAIKLRKISSPFARVTLQNKINTLLMEGELGIYDSYNSPHSSHSPTISIPSAHVVCKYEPTEML